MLDIEPKPCGARRQEQFFKTHARDGELLFVVKLPGERLAKMNGRTVAVSDRSILESLERVTKPPTARPWVIIEMPLPEGLRIERNPQV